MNAANNSSLIVDQLVTYADWFFPGEIDFDRDLDIGIVNGTDSQIVGMRRCVSNSSLSEPGESPPQGSPKPAARRKNKPAPPTPHKSDEKPPPPDKPPRPLSTATLNRATYRAQNEVMAELVSLQQQQQQQQEFKKSAESEHRSLGFENLMKQESSQSESGESMAKPEEVVEKKGDRNDRRESIGFEVFGSRNESEQGGNKSSQEMDEKTTLGTMEKKKMPVAAPRSINAIQQVAGMGNFVK